VNLGATRQLRPLEEHAPVVLYELHQGLVQARYAPSGIHQLRINLQALFGMMRMFEVLAEESFRVTRTFRITTDAEAWLVPGQSPAEPRLADGSQVRVPFSVSFFDPVYTFTLTQLSQLRALSGFFVMIFVFKSCVFIMGF